VAITITNGNEKLTITEGAESHSYNRDNLSVGTFGDYVLLFRDFKEHRRFLYTDVTTPTSTSAVDLRDEINALLIQEPYMHEVAAGEMTGKTVWNKFGYNSDVDTGAEEIIASFGGAFNPVSNVITTAQTFTITYNNGTDGLGTTGALSLLFTYIDSSFTSQIGIHTLGSTGSDVTSFTGLGINRAVVFSNGGLGYNVNDITITATDDGTTQAQVPALGSVTQQALFHTQINHNFFAEWLLINCRKLSGAGGSPRVTIRGYSWSRFTLTRYEIFRYEIDTSVENTLEIAPPAPFTVGGREVLYFTAETNTNNTVVNLRFTGVEESV